MFRDWCRRGSRISVILSFLQHLLALGWAEYTVRGYLTAVSTVQVKCDGLSTVAHPLATQFLRGMRLSSTSPKLLQLRSQGGSPCLPPFESLSSVDLQFLFWKTSLLLVIASAKQVSVLSTSSVDAPGLRFGDKTRWSIFCQTRPFSLRYSFSLRFPFLWC